MKKNGLTSAVIAGIAGVAGFGSIADAVNLNPDGLGQVLIYPYYTTQSGNDTLISVVNTSDVAKAVKVRFLEGRNSREVLDFHLYLSRFDVWTAGIFSIPEGALGYPGAGVYTRDRSCTVPDIVTATPDGDMIGQIGDVTYATFVNYAYAHLDHSAAAADLLSSVERTREGYIEMIEMANIIGAGATWVTHGATGVPTNCAAARAAWDTGGWPPALQENPTGQGELFGNAMIVNAARGTVVGYAADAIEGFNYSADLHQAPGNVEPNLNDVNDLGMAFQATANVFEFGRLISATYDLTTGVGFPKVDAISALYATPHVINEYYLDGNETIQGTSEWVVTFPTKRFYVDDNPFVDASGNTQPSYSPNAPIAPFANTFWNNGACESVQITVYDREERTERRNNFSPPRPGGSALCWEAQVVTFNQSGDSSNILGSTYFQNIATPFSAGWARISFGNSSATVPRMRAARDGEVFRGLPVTGFFVANYDNGVNDSGVLANYTSLFRHRTMRDCVDEDTGQATCS
ncbi:hypothetical protein [Pseudofulvimonas gallinarii]|uniref:Uncharacterized protein n=1 Tax=Pseudofulvimonas gallinarii TaxID=634155 RepID=A0A4S3KTI2_9GAMM|nr:hypothetical protein [Pseudofulvimonas gallinarii]TCT00380.1 hypothetical protein EDC25_103148 [Pseudofulvimonas gallinarii]THD12336.1 hypothetical protein B1808_13465 [Pseudofulvimonas gallinarii]